MELKKILQKEKLRELWSTLFIIACYQKLSVRCDIDLPSRMLLKFSSPKVKTKIKWRYEKELSNENLRERKYWIFLFFSHTTQREHQINKSASTKKSGMPAHRIKQEQ